MHPIWTLPTVQACGIVAAVEKLGQWCKSRCLREGVEPGVLVARTPGSWRPFTVEEARPPYPSVQTRTCCLQQEEHLRWRPEESLPARPLSSVRVEQLYQRPALLCPAYSPNQACGIRHPQRLSASSPVRSEPWPSRENRARCQPDDSFGGPLRSHYSTPAW